jgi:gliding motility-associated-like protein
MNGQLTNGQLFHYPFDGSANDIGVSGLNGTLQNGPTFIPGFDGTPNGAIQFDGVSNYVELPNSPNLQPPNQPITFSFWVNPSSLSSDWKPIFWMDMLPAFYNGYWCAITDGWIGIYYGDGSFSGPTARRQGSVFTSIPLNTWTHIVGIIRGPTDMDIYINCVQQNVSYNGSGGSLSWSGFNGNIGRGLDGTFLPSYKYFNGGLDEFRFWERELSASEIQQLCSTNCVNDTVRLSSDLCIGDSIFFNGRWRKQTGFYQDITTLPSGCDSIAYLTLTLKDTFNFAIYDTLCINESIEFAGQNISTAGTYFDTSSSVFGCDSISTLYLENSTYSDSIYITVEGNSCALGFVVLRANGAARYQWSNGSTEDTVQVFYNGNFQVRGSSSCGTSTAEIKLEDNCLKNFGDPPFKLYVPQVFTPNGDGINEVFLPQGNGILTYHIDIYNRWGANIFSSDNINTGWDGTFNNNIQAQGTYFYVINYTISGQFYREQRGSLYLSR